MYGDYAHRQMISQILDEQYEKIQNDPEYCRQLVKDLGLEELFSQMTEEHWKIADAKYGYKED